MNFETVISCILALNTIVFGKSVKIIGGENANIQEVSYIVSLRHITQKEHICSGALISNCHVLTAAHCFLGLRKTDVKIFIGDTSCKNYSMPYYNIYDIKIHPEFIKRLQLSTMVHHDIALITLDSCILFNKYQNKISLPTEDIKAGDDAIISGWGWSTFPLGNISPTLKKACMKILSKFECLQKVPFIIFNQQVCAFQKKGVGACYGDSGGPLVSNGELIGISSFAAPCATGAPDIYTKIYAYLDFIRSNIIYTNNSLCCLPL